MSDLHFNTNSVRMYSVYACLMSKIVYALHVGVIVSLFTSHCIKVHVQLRGLENELEVTGPCFWEIGENAGQNDLNSKPDVEAWLLIPPQPRVSSFDDAEQANCQRGLGAQQYYT